MALRVFDVAGQVGLTPATIRYYERLGLLPAPERTPSGYRQYDEDVADRLRFIKGAQRFGLRLDEIRDLLDIQITGNVPAVTPKNCSAHAPKRWTRRCAV